MFKGRIAQRKASSLFLITFNDVTLLCSARTGAFYGTTPCPEPSAVLREGLFTMPGQGPSAVRGQSALFSAVPGQGDLLCQSKGLLLYYTKSGAGLLCCAMAAGALCCAWSAMAGILMLKFFILQSFLLKTWSIGQLSSWPVVVNSFSPLRMSVLVFLVYCIFLSRFSPFRFSPNFFF